MTIPRIDARTWAARLTAAQVVVFLWFVPHMAKFIQDDSRMAYLWEPADTASLMFGMAALAVACTLAGAVVRRTGRPGLIRAFDHVFVIALAGGLLNNVAFHCTREQGYSISPDGVEMATAWLGIMMLAGYSLARPQWRLVHRCRTLCLVASPVVVIVLAQLLRPVYYPPAHDPLPVASAASSARQADVRAAPVYLFIFDEWSYTRTFADGRVRDDLPHIEAFSRQAAVFHDAHSPGPGTHQSVPQMLFQTTMPTLHDRGRVGFERGGQFVSGGRGESIFSLVPEDYCTIMVGFGEPYAPLLGSEVDFCRSYKPYLHGQGMPAKAGVHLFKVLGTSTDPWSRFVHGRYVIRLKYRFSVELNESTERDMVAVITEAPRATFAIMHHRLPHGPYIYAADGSYTGPVEDLGRHTVEAYERNLKHLDRTAGRLLDLMRRRGTFDDALVIMTSDHSWRNDPDMAWSRESVTHVPLMVKLPRQCRSEPVTQPFETWQLGRLIEAGLASDGDPEVLQKTIRQSVKQSEARPIHVTSSGRGHQGQE